MNQPFQLDKETLIKYYVNQGLTSEETAKKMGCSDSHVLKHLHLYDIPVRLKQQRVKGLSEANVRNLYENYKWSTIKIAKHLDCNDESVRKALQRYNIPIRSRAEAARLKQITPEHLAKLKVNIAKNSRGKYGENHPSWKGGRYIDSYGYVLIRRDGRVWKEHRYVMTHHLGRDLLPYEEVNHINGIKTDNGAENLEVIYSEHKHKDWLRREAAKHNS